MGRKWAVVFVAFTECTKNYSEDNLLLGYVVLHLAFIFTYTLCPRSKKLLTVLRCRPMVLPRTPIVPFEPAVELLYRVKYLKKEESINCPHYREVVTF